MQQLILTSSEKALFHALPKTLSEGWSVVDTFLPPADDPIQRMMRLQLMRLHSPSLLSFQSAVKVDPSPEHLAATIAATDLSEVSDEDLTELFFALGPEALSLLIAGFLNDAKTDDDLSFLAGLTVIRDAQCASMLPS